MVEHTQTIRRQHSTNCLSVFDHFVGLALKALKKVAYQKFLENFIRRLTIIILQANTQRSETLHTRSSICIYKSQNFTFSMLIEQQHEDVNIN